MFELVLIPLAVAVLTQVLKLIIDGIPNNLNWQQLTSSYGGMPSAHTAFVASLATVIGLNQGFDSPAFAISFVLMIIVMRDAMGFRREIGRNAIFTNTLAKKIYQSANTQTKRKIEFLNEQIGHSIREVAVGWVVGVGLSIVLYATLLNI